jgi:hypothetical protein
MNNWRGKLKLDKEMLSKTPTYYIYRSEEMSGKRPDAIRCCRSRGTRRTFPAGRPLAGRRQEAQTFL